MTINLRFLPALAVLFAIGACASAPQQANPQSAFMANLSALCGKAFSGRLVTTDAADADMAGKAMVMHVRTCEPGAVRVPFHVGEDRSRTWVITRTAQGLRLKHDHRHADGSEDTITQYGGDTATAGTATRQEFPVDQYSIDLFTRTNRLVSVTNVWAVEVRPGDVFAYQLRRANRHFRVEFDLRTPVVPPPPPWGH
jgi:hypothetical protein